ncbi:Uncharacterized protein with an alpha/beta hydrolase fold [Pilibacter termitis]|uniref:Uncharacterized protein with an alpha/beta hydrolase fold n=1 Tax=Pilibacter termitis TaxID=263852 RepID=A0A1T4L582_9ENTE|nr:alpha/beta hydrolase [Pilibacter termitis]SJZ49798.1 Uncharacterized protein with an alpha/beta hydrolase fold [Pilibacter termitis]
MKTKLLIVATLIIAVLAAVFFYAQHSIKATKKTSVKNEIPTVFVHGSSGDAYTFSTMLEQITIERKNSITPLILTIAPDGAIKESGKLDKKSDMPVIQIGFGDPNSTIENQVTWIHHVLSYLKSQHKITAINYVGYSDGGVVGLNYLEKYGQQKSLPQIKKMVTIGSPFNDQLPKAEDETIAEVLKVGPQDKSERYQAFAKQINDVPQTISFLLIAGDVEKNEQGDTVVPLSDALSVYSLLKQNHNPVKKDIVTGEESTHMHMITQNKEVREDIQNFLWK